MKLLISRGMGHNSLISCNLGIFYNCLKNSNLRNLLGLVILFKKCSKFNSSFCRNLFCPGTYNLRKCIYIKASNLRKNGDNLEFFENPTKWGIPEKRNHCSRICRDYNLRNSSDWTLCIDS